MASLPPRRYRSAMPKGLFPFAPMRFWIITAVSLLMVMRALVPTGYMLAPSADTGDIVIRICGGMAERFVSLNPHTGKMTEVDGDEAPDAPTDDGNTSSSELCPFASTAVFDLPLPPDVFLAALFGPPLLGDRPVINTVANWRARAPLPARGPPIRI
jgi:DUF2946 family protein